jgi:hypothetical protein
MVMEHRQLRSIGETTAILIRFSSPSRIQEGGETETGGGFPASVLAKNPLSYPTYPERTEVGTTYSPTQGLSPLGRLP